MVQHSAVGSVKRAAVLGRLPIAVVALCAMGCSTSAPGTSSGVSDAGLVDGLGPGSSDGTALGPGPSDTGAADGDGTVESSSGAGNSDASEAEGAGSDGSLSGSSGSPGPLWAGWPMPNAQIDVTAGAPNPESYTENGNGTVTDNVTGLVWQKLVSPAIYVESAAAAYCAGLSLAAYTDWRLPSVIELFSIVDPGKSSSSIDDTAFPDTPSSFFWSSTPSAGAEGNVWSVVFDIGAPSYAGVLESGYARCVRSPGDDAGAEDAAVEAAAPTVDAGDAAVEAGAPTVDAGDATALDAGDAAPPADRYFISSGTVYDTGTRLTWQQSASSSTYAQAEAATYCSTLGLNAATWRLPTVKELLTIVNFAVPSPGPTVDLTAFPGTPADHFWSMTPFAGPPPGDGWFVTFSTGFSDYGDVTSANYVRCVH